MILIKKNTPPDELVELKRQAEQQGLDNNEGYKLLVNPLKKQIVESLMREQGHLCAYCMREIPDTRILESDGNYSSVYIEHWIPRSVTVGSSDNKGLDYQNMFAVCSGNEKAPEATGRHKKRFMTCDKRRGNKPLKINPLVENTMNTIRYGSDGTIDADDDEIRRDLTETLNLNCTSDAVTLPQNRKAVLDTIQSVICHQSGDILSNCKAQLDIFENENDTQIPYIGIAIWWLKQQIQAMQ